MQSKKKASAPQPPTASARTNRIGNDAATIIPFERDVRPSAMDLYKGDRFMTGVGVGATLALAAMMVIAYVWVIPAMEDAVQAAQQAGATEAAALHA